MSLQRQRSFRRNHRQPAHQRRNIGTTMARPRIFALPSFTLAIFVFFSLTPSSCDAQSVIQQVSLSSIFSRHTATIFFLLGSPQSPLLLTSSFILTRGLLSSSHSTLLRQTHRSAEPSPPTEAARCFRRIPQNPECLRSPTGRTAPLLPPTGSPTRSPLCSVPIHSSAALKTTNVR